MAKSKSDTVKMYVVIGLALFAGVFAYFRFFHGKAPGAASGDTARLQVPTIDFASLQDRSLPEPDDSGGEERVIRDAFNPLKTGSQPKSGRPKPKAAPAKAKSVPSTALELSGVILGGGAPIAVINGRFLREGDEIGGFRVAEIGKNAVQLRSANRVVLLEVMKSPMSQ